MKPIAFCALLFAALPASATSITYSVNQVGPTASAVGTITTDGTLGILSPADIAGFNFTVSVAAQSGSYGLGQTYSTPAQSDTFSEGGAFFLNAPLTATASGLFYDFGDTSDSFADFGDSSNLNTVFNSVCFSGGYCSGGLPGFQGVVVFVNDGPSEVIPFTSNDQIGTATAASAAVTPEPGSLLLCGTGALGLLALVSRRRAPVA